MTNHSEPLIGTLVRLYTGSAITVGRVAQTTAGVVLDAHPLLPCDGRGSPYLPDPNGSPHRVQVGWGAITRVEAINRLSVPIAALTLPLAQIAAAARPVTHPQGPANDPDRQTGGSGNGARCAPGPPGVDLTPTHDTAAREQQTSRHGEPHHRPRRDGKGSRHHQTRPRSAPTG